MDSFLFFSLFYFSWLSFLWSGCGIFVGSITFTSVVFGSILMPPFSFQAQHGFVLDYLPSFHAHSPPLLPISTVMLQYIQHHAWPRIATFYPHQGLHLHHLILSLSQWFFSFFFPVLHFSLFSPRFMLESSAFAPMAPFRQPPPSSSLSPTSACRDTLFPAIMAADAILLVLTSTLPCPCFSGSPDTRTELSPLSSVVYLAGRVAACRAGSAIPLSTVRKPDRSDERQRIEDVGGFVIWARTWRVGGVLVVSRA